MKLHAFSPPTQPFGGFQAKLHQAQALVFSSSFDATASFRHGSSEAPNKIRYFMANLETINVFNTTDLSKIYIHDLGNLDFSFKDLQYHLNNLQRAFAYAKTHNLFPLMFGGEHTLTRASLPSFNHAFFLVLDAHLDLRESYYVDGALSPDSHASVMYRIGHEIGFDRLIYVGTRAFSPEELDFMKTHDIHHFPITELRKQSFPFFLKNELSELFHNLDIHDLYLSIDIDCLDPAYAPGVGNPEPFGLTPWEIALLIQHVAPFLRGADFVEYNPRYDPTGQTGITVARLAHLLLTTVLSTE